MNYLFLVAEHAREIMAELGFKSVSEMIGRVDSLVADKAIAHWKSDGLDLTPILENISKTRPDVEVQCTMQQDHGLDRALDNQLIERAEPALERAENVSMTLPIQNINRTVGTMLSHAIAAKHGESALPDETIHVKFKGSAGQSLGAFLSKGVFIELEGDANDYVGKGLSGGKLVIYPPKESTFVPEDNIIVGNVALYGAISGRAYFRGIAAERFCVRNSGAITCIEGVGDHGCEYMTGGRAVILGPTGRNFAAGMSGGIAYVWDQEGTFPLNCNQLTVDLDPIEQADDGRELRDIIEQHWQATGSTVARHMLDNWEATLPQFVKVMPIDYKRVLSERMQHDQQEDTPSHDATQPGKLQEAIHG